MIIFTIVNLIIFSLILISYLAYRKKKKECEADLCEIKTIIENNNAIIRKTMKPINRDGSINGAYFTKSLIELEEEK